MIELEVHSIVPLSPTIPLGSTNAEMRKTIRETEAEGPPPESRFPNVRDLFRSMGLGGRFDRRA